MDNKSLISIEVPECVDKTVKELTKKPAERIGTTLSDVIFLALWRVNFAADKKRLEYENALKNMRDELQKKEKNIPIEERKEPDFQVIGEIIEKIRYCIQKDEIRKMFENLIVSSVDKRKEACVHPYFASIISQLNTYDAIVLIDIYSYDELPVNCLKFTLRELQKSINILEKHGLIQINKKEYERLFTEEKRDYSKHEAIMIPIERWEHFRKNESKKYDPYSVDFQKDYVIIKPFDVVYKNDLDTTLGWVDARFFKSFFSLTSLGKDFCDVCIGR